MDPRLRGNVFRAVVWTTVQEKKSVLRGEYYCFSQVKYAANLLCVLHTSVGGGFEHN